ncbi:hypothetical protein BSPA111_07890 [Buttiauxella sp. A111]|nr:hypothetical protein BSPA111_07890 [Buttiauxella sp. A111]
MTLCSERNSDPIPKRKGTQYWPDKYKKRNYAVANQHLSSGNDALKNRVGYHRPSLAEQRCSVLRQFLVIT